LFPGWMVNRRVRVTLAGWFYLGLIFIFGLAAINSGNNLLYLILAVMIGALIASFWLSEMTLNDLKLSRRAPESVYAGEEFSVVYELLNQKRFFPVAGLEVLEKIEGKTTQAYFLLVRAGKSERIYAALSLATRGRAGLNELIISTRFPFGFFEKAKKIKLPGEVVVMPSLILMGADSEVSGTQAGEVHSGKKGIGSELFCFRPYVPGDHPHWIDWKATARSGEILVKENEQELEQSVALILKIPRSRPEPDSREREDLIQKAFGLSRLFLDRGFRVRLEIADRGIDFGAGVQHLKRIGWFLALFDDRENPDPGEKIRPITGPSDQCVVGGE